MKVSELIKFLETLDPTFNILVQQRDYYSMINYHIESIGQTPDKKAYIYIIPEWAS